MIRTVLAALLLAPALALAATATPSPLNFGGQSMGTTSPALAVTLTNNQGVDITISSITASAQFAQTHNCPASLAAGASCIINVTFTPAVGGTNLNDTTTVTGTLTITSSATSSPNTVQLNGTGERSLVTHYYRSILRRAPDAGGKTFWQNETTRVVSVGLNVNEVWYALSLAFFASAEYAAFNRSNNDFITDLYVTFFNRQPDAGGLSFWTSNLSQGMPREVALAEFMFSAEFRNFTQAIFGSTAVRAEVDAVTDFFRGFLARLPDDGGFNFWVGRFRGAQCTGQAASVVAEVEAISSAFALSAEYAGRARTNSQYVGDLYNAFLRRGGDLAGVQFWIGQLNSGAQTREQVRVAFKNSPEFQGRVNAIIAAGCNVPQLDCASAAVLCVGGPQSEYATIQAAVNAASPAAGKTVLVFDGNYAGFRIPNNRSGTVGSSFTVKAQGQNAVITSMNSNDEGVSISNANHVVVEGFRMTGMPVYGIGCHDAAATAPMQNVTIRNNHVTNSGDTNIYCSNAASLIEGNTSGNAGRQGIYVANGGADNTIVRGNTVYGNGTTGLHVNGDLSIGGDGLVTGMLIEDNVFYENADNGVNMDGLQDSTIRNNLIYNNGRNGIRGYQVDASAGAGNMRVVNNTIVVPAAAGSACVKFTADIGGHTIFNNILINLGTNNGTIVTGNTNFKSDHNIVVNGGFSVNEGGTMLNFAQWKALAGGYDANSTVSTTSALFVDAAANNYRLKAGAPAANTGVATFNGIAAPPKDITGVTRPVGGVYDRGAYESF